MLMMESAEQMPHFTQTGSGGKRMANRPRKQSAEHMVMVLRVSEVVCGFNEVAIPNS